jgi:hypothetical protein
VAERVFLSYSRRDEPIVRALADVQSASGVDVRVDTRFLDFGKPWSEEILARIRDSQRMLVFWSRHSSRSDEVRKEYEFALAVPGLCVVPVLLDETPLPPPLRPLHGVTSLRPIYAGPPRTSVPFLGKLTAAVVVIGSGFLIWKDSIKAYFQSAWSKITAKADGDAPPELGDPWIPPALPPAPETATPWGWYLAGFAAVVAIVLGGLAWLRREAREEERLTVLREAWEEMVRPRAKLRRAP